MTVLKDPIPVRPTSQHRHGSSMAGSLPKSRPHSHSLSASSPYSTHRAPRRKSITSATSAAMHAAGKGFSGAPLEAAQASRRPTKSAHVRAPAINVTPAMASSVPMHAGTFGSQGYNGLEKSDSAVVDGPPLAIMNEQSKAGSKSRIRRASEGSRHGKLEGKRSNGGDLRCEECGKGYKHSSCLTKHLWEHTPEWQYTSKLLISKHQQVQLLEAASVLVAMTAESNESDSPSPPASGTSDARDGSSSADTTPPPQDHHAVGSLPRPHLGRISKRYSSASSVGYSHSYQSAVFSDGSHHGHFRQWSNVSDRPTTSGTSVAGSYRDDENDQADLAAAVGLLSCSYGTPKTGPAGMAQDVPPVPPLPARFLDFGAAPSLSGSTLITAQQSSLRSDPFRYHSARPDVVMDEDEDGDFRGNSLHHARIDEDEEAFFGRMEE